MNTLEWYFMNGSQNFSNDLSGKARTLNKLYEIIIMTSFVLYTAKAKSVIIYKNIVCEYGIQ